MISLKSLLTEQGPVSDAPKLKSQRSPYYYEPGDDRTRSSFTTGLSTFPFTSVKSNAANSFYDILGRKVEGYIAPNTVKGQDAILEPRVATSWFTVYAGETAADGTKVVGYHPGAGVITDPLTFKVLYSPGKNMTDKAVYNWLYNFSGKGAMVDRAKVLVGTKERKTGTV